MKKFSVVVLSFVLLAPTAMPASASLSNTRALASQVSSQTVTAVFEQGHEVIGGIAARREPRARRSDEMAEGYFDADLIVTLGSLALTTGAFLAASVGGIRRRFLYQPTLQPTFPPLRSWEEAVLQELEADLAKFTLGATRAA